jgi:hypothetical protein
VLTKLLLKNLKERFHLEDLGVDRRIILEWFRIGTSGGHL